MLTHQENLDLPLSIRPRFGSLGHSSLLPNRLLKRSTQGSAWPGKTAHPQQMEPLNPAFRRLPWSSHRSYTRNSYGYYTPISFWARNKPTIVVGGVIGLCCGTYYWQWTAAKVAERGDHALSDLIRRNFINSAENIREGRWWVLISSSFAHGNLLHLGFNMIALWGFGSGFVGMFGVPWFVGLWTFSAASCSAAQIYWQHTQERLRRETVGRRLDKRDDPTILGIRISRERALAISGGSGVHGPQFGGSLGASGAVCGLTGMFLCTMPKMPIQQLFFLPMPLWLGEVALIVGSAFCMATGYAPEFGHAGHLGGTAAGIAYYYGAVRPWLRRTGRF
ncbi:MAG: hypothetical protein ASARMPRED_003679 [Alectoria sarmentosa]|nr:MAG: hypothetical protein ASARMPRED_003679 [Alectoria sarmentosa]